MSASSEHIPIYLAVTGTDASGKDTYAHHLERLGYMHVSAGDVIREEARARGHTDPISRDVLSKAGDDMKARYGSAPIVLRSIERYREQQDAYPAGLVISGLRRVAEVTAFKERGATVLYADAAPELRFQWQSAREGRDKAGNLDKFIERGRIEYYGLTKAGEKGVYLRGVEDLADCKLMNDGSKEKFIRNADLLLGLTPRFDCNK